MWRTIWNYEILGKTKMISTTCQFTPMSYDFPPVIKEKIQIGRIFLPPSSWTPPFRTQSAPDLPICYLRPFTSKSKSTFPLHLCLPGSENLAALKICFMLFQSPIVLIVQARAFTIFLPCHEHEMLKLKIVREMQPDFYTVRAVSRIRLIFVF